MEATSPQNIIRRIFYVLLGAVLLYVGYAFSFYPVYKLFDGLVKLVLVKGM